MFSIPFLLYLIMRHILTIFLISSIGISLRAQLPTDIHFTNYTRANGLPEENINNILEDHRGFIWIGSREGLFRYDGLHFKAWYADPADPLNFHSNNIRVAGETSAGDFLFISGTELWQINIVNQHFHRTERFKEKTILEKPFRLKNGQWLILDADSVFLTNGELLVQSAYSLHPNFKSGSFVSSFALSMPWVLLYSVQASSSCFFNIETGAWIPVHFDDSGLDSRSQFYTPQLYDPVTRILYLSTYFNGNFYCRTGFPDTTGYKPVPFTAQPTGRIRKTVQTREGLILQAGEFGLSVTDGSRSVLFNDETVTEKPPVSKLMLDIFYAHDGSCWISTTKGICRFNLQQHPVDYIRLSAGNSDGLEFKSILKGADGNIYFLTSGTSLSMLDPKTKKVEPCDRSLPYSWSAGADGNEIILTGGPRAMVIYNTSTRHVKQADVLKPFFTDQTDLITLVFIARNHDRWYSCNGGGGLIREPAGSGRFISYNRNTDPPAFSHSYVHTATEDRNGNIWWGSNKNDKLLKWDAAHESFTEIETDKLIPGFSGNAGINNLFADGDDNLWIALDGAALIRYHLPTQKGTYYDIHHGMPSDVVSGITADARKRVWISTRKGLCCYLPGQDKLVSFSTQDGFPDDNFEGNGLYFDPVHHRIYAGSDNAISWFDPDSLLKQAIAVQPHVFIDEMKVNGSSFPFQISGVNTLQPGQNNIEVSFSAADFIRNSHLQFQYRLNNSERSWTDLGENRTVSFNNLIPGLYTLSVRCRYPGNPEWTETTLPLHFRIETPWQQSIWFRTLVLLCITAFVIYMIRNYYRQKLEKAKAVSEKLRAVEMERTRIATDMHDDFGASLSRIKFISEKVQLSEIPDESIQHDLLKISRYSDEMAEKMNEIVWALNERYDSVSDLVSFCRLYASEYFSGTSVQFRFRTAAIPERKIPGEERRNIFLVIKEALHNIKKHADATEASLDFSFEGMIRVVITDNGKGFDTAHVRAFANGLQNMKKRINDIRGSLEIVGEKGTRITITVPF